MKYMIHTHPKRSKYVDNYLIPSLINQGIDEDDIYVVLDTDGAGNLKSFLYSLKIIKTIPILNEEIGLWHLQDDVIVSKDFKKKAEMYAKKDVIVNGFVSSNYNKMKLKKTGKQPVKESWLSMPCMFIPNRLINDFLNWLDSVKNEDRLDYKKRYKSNRHDDFFFYMFMQEMKASEYCYNLKPNLADHIDFLVGASINKPRTKQVRGYYFKDLDLVEELERKLKND